MSSSPSSNRNRILDVVLAVLTAVVGLGFMFLIVVALPWFVLTENPEVLVAFVGNVLAFCLQPGNPLTYALAIGVAVSAPILFLAELRQGSEMPMGILFFVDLFLCAVAAGFMPTARSVEFGAGVALIVLAGVNLLALFFLLTAGRKKLPAAIEIGWILLGIFLVLRF